MILNMNGGGDNGLNFSVVEYESENHLPKTETENTIAIITSTEFTSWFLSKTTPSTKEEGAVWIKLCSSSSFSFNALDENGINICIEHAKQYIGGYWIFIDAYIYQDKWLQFSNGFDGQLFNNGIVNKDITGGWQRSDGQAMTGNEMNTVGYSLSSYSPLLYTAKKIDISGFSTLYVNITEVQKQALIGIHNAATHDVVQYAAYKYEKNTGVTALDISNVNTGEYYIIIAAGIVDQWNPTVSVTVNKIWLE